jgi:hypothetical protein
MTDRDDRRPVRDALTVAHLRKGLTTAHVKQRLDQIDADMARADSLTTAHLQQALGRASSSPAGGSGASPGNPSPPSPPPPDALQGKRSS